MRFVINSPIMPFSSSCEDLIVIRFKPLAGPVETNEYISSNIHVDLVFEKVTSTKVRGVFVLFIEL